MIHKILKGVLALAVVLIPALVLLTSSPASLAAPLAQEGDPERGAYVVALTGGCGCHNSEAGTFAGGGEFGPFYAANITPDPATGIGDWTAQEIVDAVRLGQHPDGSNLGVMPYHYFSQMSDEDAFDMAAYLLNSVEPVENEVPESDMEVPAFEPEEAPPSTAPVEGVERGEYVAVLAHCAECHTPTNEDGSLDMDRFMGGKIGRSGDPVANLTPHETGMGDWSEEQIATYLMTAERPDGTTAEEGRMVGMILSDQGFQNWTEDDAMAVAAYLKTLEPVEFTPPEAEAEADEGEMTMVAPEPWWDLLSLWS